MTHADPLIFSSLWIAILVAIIIVSGAIVQAGMGMGFGLTVAPLLALIDPALVPATTLYLGMFTATLGVIREPHAIEWGEVKWGALGRLVGVFVGGVVLVGLTDLKTFSLVFGLVVGIAVLMTALGWQLAFTSLNLFSMSCVSGAMGIITSVGAPPMALLYSQRPPDTARPTMAAFFAIGCGLSILGLLIMGWSSWRDLATACLMVPGVLFGTFLARKFQTKFDKRYRGILLTIAGIASLLLIIRGIS